MNATTYNDGHTYVTFHETAEKANAAALADLRRDDVAAVATTKLTPGTVEKYGPCPCGSGKKLKFCCYGK